MTSETGETAPEPPRTFASLGLGEAVLKALDDMGWDEPTPVQAESYAPIVSGRDVVVQARTGTGKTGAFGIPIVDRLVSDEPGVQALLLAPTRELALQSARELAKIGAHKELRTTAVYGGAPMERQVRELKEGAQIVSGTPGRVLDHLRRGTMDTSKLAVLVLDEADEMLSMGFAKELNAILELLPESRQTLLYSATVDGPVMRVGERHMKDPLKLELSGDAVGALTITHYAFMVSGKGRAKDLVKILEAEDPESAIIFCNTKVETERTAGHLQAQGFAAEWLNGDLPQGEREKVMAKTREGKCRFLVATDVAARGIDISHLTHVINFSLPDHLEQYIHRTGRTGRAGRTGTAMTLVAPQELGQLYYLRLQYKIFPVERSLPSAGEAQTRREQDRVDLLAAAFAGAPSGIDDAVARRLLTHPEAERIVAGLVGTFFGAEAQSEEEVDELAAAARRERPAPPVGEDNASPSVEAAPETKPAPRAAKRPASEQEEPRRSRSRSRREEEDEDEEGMERLYVNIGRRDGVRVGDLLRLFSEVADVERDDIGRIRLRDKHSFVSIPEEDVEEACEALTGEEYEGRELKVEPARR